MLKSSFLLLLPDWMLKAANLFASSQPTRPKRHISCMTVSRLVIMTCYLLNRLVLNLQNTYRILSTSISNILYLYTRIYVSNISWISGYIPQYTQIHKESYIHIGIECISFPMWLHSTKIYVNIITYAAFLT